MAAKKTQKLKKSSPITGTPRNSDDKLTVQKSNPMYGLWRSDLSLADFKVLDTYLSRINSHDPDHRTVHFEKGEIEQILGIKQLKADDLKKRLAHLGTMVPVDDPTEEQKFRMVSLFEEAICQPDADGIWQVSLTCTNAARKYIFNMENLGYFRYKLRTVTRLRSRYSYILFLYLEKNRHMHSTWDIGLDELKLLLKCEAGQNYQQYKRFNEKILKRCHKELTENTECQFTYEPVKRGRTVKAVRFILETVADQLEGQLSFSEVPVLPIREDALGSTYSTELLGFLASACDYEFDGAEMRVLLDLILHLYPYGNDGGVERFNYLRQKYNILTLYASKQKISSRFGYIKSLIEKDIHKHAG